MEFSQGCSKRNVVICRRFFEVAHSSSFKKFTFYSIYCIVKIKYSNWCNIFIFFCFLVALNWKMHCTSIIHMQDRQTLYIYFYFHLYIENSMTTIRPINDIWYCNLVHYSYDYSHSCERREGFQARTKQLHDQYISRNDSR